MPNTELSNGSAVHRRDIVLAPHPPGKSRPSPSRPRVTFLCPAKARSSNGSRCRHNTMLMTRYLMEECLNISEFAFQCLHFNGQVAQGLFVPPRLLHEAPE